MLRQRIGTGLVLAPLALALVFYLPPAWIELALAPILAIAAWEWVRLAGVENSLARLAGGLALGALVGFGLPLLPDGWALPALGAGVAAWFIVAFLWLPQQPGAAGGTAVIVAKLLAGILILLFAGLALATVFRLTDGRLWLLCLLLVIWGADIGAYFSGKRFGRRKLAPSISPGKTWEGVVGGLLMAVLVGVVAGRIAGFDAGKGGGLALLCLGTAAISIVGDLFASLLKRQQGLKDTSALLPGHGGIIDRTDSLLAAGPLFATGLVALGVR
ncbi:MAG: phosphatidate cytidylyltransferase [Pseudomonadota bacterium]